MTVALNHPAINYAESSGNLICLDRQLKIYSNDDLPDGLTFSPSSKWSSGFDFLIKLRNRDNKPITRHPGLEPAYRVIKMTIRGDHRCAGVLMSGVTGSMFQGLFITDCVGPSLAFERCGETDFYSLQVTNGSIDPARPKGPLVDLGYVTNNVKTEIGGNNNLRFFGGRIVNNAHLVYVNVDSQDEASPCRKNNWFSTQFHVPPPFPFLGQPTPDHIKDQPERVMLWLGPDSRENQCFGCNFTTRNSIAYVDNGRDNQMHACTFRGIDD